MKTRGCSAGAVVAVALLLGAGSAHAGAQVSFDPEDPGRATGITNLGVNGTFYDVAFTLSTTAAVIYDRFPGDFDVTSAALAEDVVDAVNLALNGADVESVGSEENPIGSVLFRVGYGSAAFGGIQTVLFWEGTKPDETEPWVGATMPDADSYNLGERVWARLTPVDPGPECPADLDGDSTVGFNDLTLLLGNWGACEGCPEDLDGDDTVGFNDLTILLGNWGPCPD